MNVVAGYREGTLNSSSFPTQTSLAQFAAQHSVALTRFAFLLCGDHQRAEDLVQDAYLALHRRFGAVLTVEAPVAYARRSIVNAHISQARRRSASERVTDDLPEFAATAADTAEQDAMWRALTVLPERQRAVLVLRYYLDLPDAEIAGLLGCRTGTVRSLATRAFAALRTSPALAEDHR